MSGFSVSSNEFWYMMDEMLSALEFDLKRSEIASDAKASEILFHPHLEDRTTPAVTTWMYVTQRIQNERYSEYQL